MRVVAIGDEEEYTSRLVRFLEDALPEDIHVVSYTNPESFMMNMSSYTYCVTGERFWEDCLNLQRSDGQGKAGSFGEHNHIMISEREKEGAFYRYHSPARLADIILKKLGDTGDDLKKRRREKSRIIALYTPVYDEDMLFIAQHFMEEGFLYLGMEDMGNEINEKGDVSDLCYYIRLRDEQIFEKVKEIRRLEGRCYFVDSPPLYYDFAGLSASDYQWLFQKFREDGSYRGLCLGMGSAAVHNAELFQYFDQVVVLDSKKNFRQHSFCKRFARVMDSGIPAPAEGVILRYREDLLYESAQ